MKEKENYHILAVYSLEYKSGRKHFSAILDELSIRNWRLSTVRPGRYFSCKELISESGEPYDGIILSMPGTDGVMEKIANSDIPTVLVNIADRRITAQRSNFSSIWHDNADIGKRAALHLLQHSEYECVGFVHWHSHRFYSDERMRAFRHTMKCGGYDTLIFPPENNPKKLRQWLKDLPKPAAIMAATDIRAAEIINICRDEGISVPAHVSVIGADYDTSQHEKCGMTITSVGVNEQLLGRYAVRELEFLFRHPKRNGRPHEIVVPAGDLFIGESTVQSSSGAHLVKTAHNFITERLNRKITPSDVIAHLGCSRSLAELRFSQIEGKTIRKAIEDARLNEVQRRLANRETVRSIVKSMQFTSANQLYRIYKRHFGHTIIQSRGEKP